MDVFCESRIFMLLSFLPSIFLSAEFAGEAGKSFDGRSLTVENAGHDARRKRVPY